MRLRFYSSKLVDASIIKQRILTKKPISLLYNIHCVQKKVSPLKILQHREENFTELNISLFKDSHMYFKQWCEVSPKYTLAFVRNQTLNKNLINKHSCCQVK